MLQVTKGLTTKLTIPVDYINNVDGEKTRDAFTWDAGDEILVTLKHKRAFLGYDVLGYEATTSESGAIEFELNGTEAQNKYDVHVTFTRGGVSFNCYVGTLQIIDKATPDLNTLNGVYIYAEDDTIKFIKAYDGERNASIAELNAAREQAQQNGGGGGGGGGDAETRINKATEASGSSNTELSSRETTITFKPDGVNFYDHNNALLVLDISNLLACQIGDNGAAKMEFYVYINKKVTETRVTPSGIAILSNGGWLPQLEVGYYKIEAITFKHDGMRNTLINFFPLGE